MKKLFIYPIILTAASVATAQTTSSATGNLTTAAAGSRAEITAADVITLNSNTVMENGSPKLDEDGNVISHSMYRGLGTTVAAKKIIVKDANDASGLGYANFAGGLVVDAGLTTDAADDDYAFQSRKLMVVSADYTFKNSASNTAKVNIAFGELVLDSTSEYQKQYLIFDNINAHVTTTKTQVAENVTTGESIITVNDNASLTWNGELRIGKKGTTKNSSIEVAGTMTTNNELKLFSGTSTLTGKLITNSSFYVDSKGTLNIDGGDLEMKHMNLWGKVNDISTNRVNQLTFKNVDAGSGAGGVFTQSIATGETGVRFLGQNNQIIKGSSFTVNERFDIGGEASASALKIDNVSKVTMVVGAGQDARVRLLANATLTLAGEDAIKNQDGTYAKLVSMNNQTYSNTNNIYIGGTQRFSTIEVKDNSVLGIRYGEDGAKLLLTANDGAIRLLGNAKVSITGTDLVANNDGTYAKLISTNTDNNTVNALILTGTQHFSSIEAVDNSLNIRLDAGSVLYLMDDASLNIAEGKYISIYDFKEDSIYVGTGNSQSVIDRVSADVSSQLYVTSNGWLTAVAPSVPEPAEWAAIFGAIALGLAIYRKRNK